MLPTFVLLAQDCFGYLGVFPYDFFSISVKNVIGILIVTELNLCIRDILFFKSCLKTREKEREGRRNILCLVDYSPNGYSD